jgi:hypothetical protein
MKTLAFILIMIVALAAQAGADVVIVKVPPSPDPDTYCRNDGYVYGRDTNGIWINACSAGNALNNTFGTMIVGNRSYTTPDPDWFYRWKSFVRFDLTAYEGEINSIKLFLWCWRKRGGGPWTPVTVYKTNPDWYPLSNDDFEMSAPWTLGSRTVASVVVGNYNSWNLNPTPLSLGEWLPLRIEDEDLNCMVPPQSDDWDTFEFYTGDLYGQADTTKAPFLLIDYTPAPKGVYQAKVQTEGSAARLGNFGMIRTKEGDDE